MFDWNLHEEPEEVMSEICEGIGKLSRDNVITLMAALVYEMGIEFKEISTRIEEDDGSQLSIADYFQ